MTLISDLSKSIILMDLWYVFLQGMFAYFLMADVSILVGRFRLSVLIVVSKQ